MVWAILLLQDIPQDLQGWTKKGAWKWKEKTLTAVAQSSLTETSWATLCQEAPANEYTIQVELLSKADAAYNSLVCFGFQKHDFALNLDFEKSKTRAALGFACTYTDQGALAYYETLSKPLDNLKLNQWVRVKIEVGAEVKVFFNDVKTLESDLSDLIHNYKTHAKDQYGKRVHQGIGLGAWNQSAGGNPISLEFRNFKLSAR